MDKKWYESKAVWTAIIAGLLHLTQGIASSLGHSFTIPDWVNGALASFGLYALRDGVDKPIS